MEEENRRVEADFLLPYWHQGQPGTAPRGQAAPQMALRLGTLQEIKHSATKL